MSTEQIVKFISQVSYEQLPGEAVNAAKRSITDCLGVALASCEKEASDIVTKYIAEKRGKPEAGVIAGGFKTSAPEAAWANGTKAHILDFDDYFLPFHPTAAILPAVLAIAEKHHLNGKDVLLGYVTGFEVEANIASILGEQHHDIGWHSTSVLGSLGAAAAIAKMLKLDEGKISMALGIAGSLSAGLIKNFGTMTKPLHAGNANGNGIMAALLSHKGFTADRNILEGPLGLIEILGSQEDSGIKETDKELGRDFYIISPGINIKPYPSCAGSHWAIDTVLDLKREHSIAVGDITDIECRAEPELRRVLIHSQPKTGLEGKFSLEFCLSVALIDGEVSLRHFTDEEVNNSAVQEFMKKVKYANPGESATDFHDANREIVIKLSNGKSYSGKVGRARGTPKKKLGSEEVNRKYRDCVHPYMSSEDIETSLDMISNLESVQDLSKLMDIFTFSGKQYK